MTAMTTLQKQRRHMRTNTFIAFKQQAFQFVLLVLIFKSLRSTSLFHLQGIISKIICIN